MESPIGSRCALAADARGCDDRRMSGGDEDIALVSRIAAQDADALASLYDGHAARLLGVAFRVLRDRCDAEDLIHDVFLEVWNTAARYDPSRASVRTWLVVKTRSRAIDRARSLALARRHGITESAENVEVADFGCDLRVLRSVDRARALEALASLPEAQRTVVEMSYLQGFSYSEIAERCRLPTGTVKSRLARAVNVLRERLTRDEGVES